ncbi:MerR family transcriptional regulator [Sphingobacterium faecale]|uniref:Helix-turn-helix domain-containing protein n=1 Tax=Sphingobacterium faecale TaxID=2803775 RepID=A0ABS1QXR5_9SPHI|nr:hypothetical protein [Sphingobacterium faecale]MBL1407225.1 hypothetical protein [Sphingobacterium faecale]
MEDHLIRLYLTVKRMVDLLENISDNTDLLAGKSQSKVYFKSDVMSVLRISESTYKRYVKQGKLKPARIGSMDIYQEEHLKPIIAELQRRGRM